MSKYFLISFQETAMKTLKYSLAALFLALFAAHAPAMEISFSEAEGFGVSDHLVQINNIRVDTPVANPFDPNRPQIYSIYYDVPFRFDMHSLHLVPDLSGAVTDDGNRNCANLTISVQNAMTGTALNGATVTVANQSAVTADGIASFSALPAGMANVMATMPDFSADSLAAQLVCGANSLGVALNPLTGTDALEANEIRVILTWGEEPYDLDSHLTGPQPGLAESIENEANRFHVYWYNETSSDSIANLDVDDVTSFGPETITISPPAGATNLRAGIYRYSVHHYAGEQTMADARVRLLIGNAPARTFTPEATSLRGDNDVWTVFELNVSPSGQITVLPVNTYAYNVYEENIRSAIHGASEPYKLFLQPRK
jgi:hypothetical protein